MTWIRESWGAQAPTVVATTTFLADGSIQAMMVAKLKLGAAVIGVVLAVGAGGGAVRLAAAEPALAESLKNLPVNEWKLLSDKAMSGYYFAQPVFVPARGQVLHWGLPYRADSAHNDVRAFSVSIGRWTSDHASCPAKELLEFCTYDREGGAGGNPDFNEMLASNGAPRPWAISNGICFVPKRNEVICGGLYAYNVETRKWRMLKPTWILGGKEYREVLPCAALSCCYDPVNDELVAFPHHGTLHGRLHGGPQMERLPGGHRIVGHFGTLVYSFKDNTWRQTGETMGSEEMDLADKISGASDGAYALRREHGKAKADEVSEALAAAVGGLGKIVAPEASREAFGKIAPPLQGAAGAAKEKKWDAAVDACGRALWALDELMDGALQVEPAPRTGTPMVYDPGSQVIVLFGGQSGLCRYDLHLPVHNGDNPGKLNDTWLYDCKTRQWRNVSKPNRPPEELWPRVVYDPASGKVLLVKRDAIWGLDVSRAEWSLLHKSAWPGKTPVRSCYASSHSMEEVCLDEKRGLLMLLQPDGDNQETFVMKLDVSKMSAKPVEAYQEPPPVKPQVIPPDDSAWVEKLKTLPANTWVDSKANPKPPNKGYTNAACDPVRGHVYFFGGGHGDYQSNDVEIYAVGANRWVYAAGDNNDWVPPTGWSGWCMGLRGGMKADHMLNYYYVVDGRLYVSAGTGTARPGEYKNPDMEKPGPRFAHFYDVDRLGVWRVLQVAKIDKYPKVLGTWGRPHMSTSDGRLIGFGGRLEPYDGRFSAPADFYSYDIYANELKIVAVPDPGPGAVDQCRPFCFVPDRGKQGQVLFFEGVGYGKVARTWVYDIETNVFTDLKPKRQPPGMASTLEYVNGQNAAFAVIGCREQWVYSFEKNDWAPLPIQSDGCGVTFVGPYTQLHYSAKYGVLVNLPSTLLMRPDLSQVKWE